MALSHHIQKLQDKPLHVRERIAFGTSAGITAIVAIGWLVGMSASGSFSLATKSIAESVRPPETVSNTLSEGNANFKSLLGAASTALGNPDAPAAINVVDARTSTTLPADATTATVIPF